jgi:hypothetical protein
MACTFSKNSIGIRPSTPHRSAWWNRLDLETAGMQHEKQFRHILFCTSHQSIEQAACLLPPSIPA